MDSMTVDLPAHVGRDLVFDFDIYQDDRIGEDVQGTYADAVRAAPDIFWTTRNGGHWVVKSYAGITAVVTDPEHFSAREMQIPRVENPPFMIPLNMDPPQSLPYRRALTPMFGPVAIKALEPRIRHWAVALIDAVIEKGECDFQFDIAKVFPVSVFMERMGMDLSRLQEFRTLTEDFFLHQGKEPELSRLAGIILGILTELIAEKRATPDGKLVSYLIAADIGGRTMTDDELLAMCFVLFVGGMDTVTNVTGFTYRRLAGSPDVQEKLAADPSLIPTFVDESIRLHGVINTPRLVVKEQTIGDAHFMPGDMVLSLLPIANRDGTKYDNPEELDLMRDRTAHLTFSTGPHLCVGHVLARSEIRILTEEWVKRIPSFSAKPGEKLSFRTGTVMALENLPLRWAA